MSTGASIQYPWGTTRANTLLERLLQSVMSLSLQLEVIDAEAAMARAEMQCEHWIARRKIDHIHAGQVDGKYDRARAEAQVPWPTVCEDGALKRVYADASARCERARAGLAASEREHRDAQGVEKQVYERSRRPVEEPGRKRVAARKRRTSPGERIADERGRSAASPERPTASVALRKADCNIVLPISAQPQGGGPGTADDAVVATLDVMVPIASEYDASLSKPQIEGREEVTFEPSPRPPALPIPVILPALEREVARALGDVDRPEADQAEVDTVTDKVLDIFSAEAELQRAKLRDPRRLPEGYDSTWADHWQMDPNAHLQEIYDEFITFGAAIDKAPEDLTDDEARLLVGIAWFPEYEVPHEKLEQYKDDPYGPYFTRKKDVAPWKWENKLRHFENNLQMAAARVEKSLVSEWEIERSRHRLWPNAVARRDLIKGLMEGLIVGELDFEPRSTAEADLARSVRWRVFREADHDWLGLVGREELALYYHRILDKLPWPPGLSRLELLDRFGQGQEPTNIPNMSTQGRPPTWLLPDHDWVYGEAFGLRSGTGEGERLGGTTLSRYCAPFMPAEKVSAPDRTRGVY